MGSRTVAVIGDVVADEFVYGRVARVSREAPVLILEYDSTEIVPGGGGNAANSAFAFTRPRERQISRLCSGSGSETIRLHCG